MKNTIAAIRAEYLGVSIALAALLLVALLSFQNSKGVVRGGDDDGSGIGGTGVSPSESGFGGTGLKPYLGLTETNASNEVTALPGNRQASVAAISSQLDFSSLEITEVATHPALAPQVTSDQFQTRDSSAINITEAIQASLNELAVLITDQNHSTSGSAQKRPAENPVTTTEPSALLAQHSNPEPHNLIEGPVRAPAKGDSVASVSSPGPTDAVGSASSSVSIAATEAFPVQESAAEIGVGDLPSEADEPINIEDTDTADWNALANYLANESPRPVDDDPAAGQRPATDSRSTATRKIQRPELPPVQRHRPVERLSILPPRIQPLRL